MWGTLVVRADTGPGVGAGHVLRDLALVERWTAAGDAAVVVGPGPDSALGRRAAAAGAEVVAGVDPGPTETTLRGVVGDRAPSWVVLDGAPFDHARQEAVRRLGARLLVVDDHARHGRYAADLVLDQNLDASTASYADLGGGRALLGASFTLLRREFTDLRRERDYRDEPRQVTVVLGGDPVPEVLAYGDQVTAGVRAALPHLTATFRRGGSAIDTPWATQLAASDLVVSAAGGTTWEVCHLGLPAVLVAVADDQEPVGTAVAARGAASWLGRIPPRGAASVTRVVDEVARLAADADARQTMGAVAAAVVDGRGAARVAAAMRADLLRLRPASEADARLLWEWSNEPGVRAASFETAPIPWDDHVAWLAGRLADPTGLLLVGEGPDGTPVGQVRFETREGGDLEIGVSVDVAHRGSGIAAALIVAGVTEAFGRLATPRIVSRIRTENRSSVAAFLAAGFVADGDVEVRGRPAVRLVRSRADAH